MVICGQAWFDKLPAEYQEVMKKDFNDCAYNNAQDIIAAQDDMEKTLTDNGMTIVEVDKDIFREAVKPAYEAGLDRAARAAVQGSRRRGLIP